MKVLSIILIIVFILIVSMTIGVTMFTFYHPEKNRVVPKVITEFDREYYGTHTDELIRAMDEMDETETETVFIVSDDGYKLRGHLFIRDISKPFILFAHGYHGTYMRDGYGSYLISKKTGLNILMIEQRAHGKSEGNFITFGVKERCDVFRWIEFLNDKYNNPEIVLSGVSMGAATVMMAAGLELPGNVKGIIEDCGYTSPKEIIINTAKGMKLPGKTLYPFARIGAMIASKADMNSCKAIECMKDTKLPVMFIHSKTDGFVPFEMNNRLYEVCDSDKMRLIIEDTAHAVTALYHYPEYECEILKFLQKIKVI